jgi:hypothetical protein
LRHWGTWLNFSFTVVHMWLQKNKRNSVPLWPPSPLPLELFPILHRICGLCQLRILTAPAMRQSLNIARLVRSLWRGWQSGQVE